MHGIDAMQSVSEIIDLGKWTEASLDKLLRSASAIPDRGEVAFLSERFLGTPTARIRSQAAWQHEAFVVNLRTVDCFTFIDYVEA